MRLILLVRPVRFAERVVPFEVRRSLGATVRAIPYAVIAAFATASTPIPSLPRGHSNTVLQTSQVVEFLSVPIPVRLPKFIGPAARRQETPDVAGAPRRS